MKSKDLIKAICKSGMIDGSIYEGKSIKESYLRLEEGSISSKKEYFYTFTKVGYIEPDAVIITVCNEKVYLYQI